MLKVIVIVMLLCGTAMAGDVWDLRGSVRGPATDGPATTYPREMEMRPRYNSDIQQRYRGEMEGDGYIRMKNPYSGDTLRGTIEPDGYGKMRDSDGNIWRVKPR